MTKVYRFMFRDKIKFNAQKPSKFQNKYIKKLSKICGKCRCLARITREKRGEIGWKGEKGEKEEELGKGDEDEEE